MRKIKFFTIVLNIGLVTIFTQIAFEIACLVKKEETSSDCLLNILWLVW
jgi:hypothetical protein